MVIRVMSSWGLGLVCIVVLGLAVCGAAGQTAPAEKLPVINLADMAGEDVPGWTDVQADGDRKFRIAPKGGPRQIRVKAWWDENAPRPPENATYILTIAYKDTVSTPGEFLVYGGLDRYGGPSVTGYLGGQGDNKWKTAAAAASWDYLVRLRDARDKTAFGIRADADLPVASIQVRPATKQDQEEYNAAIRAHVAGIQQEKRKAVKLQPAELKPAGDKLPAVAAFSWPAMVPLPPNGQPKPEQLGGTIKIRMCTNEIEGGAFGVYANGVDLSEVDYTVSELVGPGGPLKADVVCRTAEYALVQAGGGLAFFPQRLWPAYKVDIPKGLSHWFVFNVRAHRGQSKPGLYKGRVAITSKQGQASLPVEVEVLPVDLLTMDEAGLLMGGCVTGLVPAHDVAFQADYNQNGMNLWYSGVAPPLSLAEGKLKLDFAALDEWMVSARKRGLKAIVYFLGGDPYGWPWTATIFRELGLLEKGRATDADKKAWVARQTAPENRDKILPETRPLFVEWVKQFTAHARSGGWPEIILTPFDEPAKWVQNGKKDPNAFGGSIGAGEWIKPFFKDACAAIRQADPQTRIYGSIHHNRLPAQEGITFLDDITVFCTNAIHEDPKLGDKVRAARKDFWQYSGAGAAGTPDQARYTFGFFFAAYDSRGSLCWAYNWGRGWDTTEGSNWMYAWQTPYDTIPGPYFEGMREAWDDRRVIETYKLAFAGDQDAKAALEGILKEAVARRTAGGRDTVSDFWAAIDDAGKLDAWRNQLLDRLVKAKAATPK